MRTATSWALVEASSSWRKYTTPGRVATWMVWEATEDFRDWDAVAIEALDSH